MTIETLIAMIERRGYEAFRWPEDVEKPRLYECLTILHRKTQCAVTWAISLLDLENAVIPLAGWRDMVERRLLLLSGRDRHLWCRQCHTPVLQSHEQKAIPRSEGRRSWQYGKTLVLCEYTLSGPRTVHWTIDREEPDRWLATCYERYVYRLVADGPTGEPMTTCPRCHALLAESACEIEDAPEDRSSL